MRRQANPPSQGVYACYMGLKLPLPDGRQVEVTIERDTPEEEGRAAAEFLGHSLLGTTLQGPAALAPKATPDMTFQGLADAHIRNKRESGAIDEKTQGQYRASLELVGGIIGQKKCQDLDWSDADRVLESLKRYPAHATKRYPGLSASQLLELKDGKPFLTVGTINSLLTRASALCRWGVRRNLLAKNPFEATQCKDRRADHELRSHYSESDLRRLFDTWAAAGFVDTTLG